MTAPKSASQSPTPSTKKKYWMMAAAVAVLLIAVLGFFVVTKLFFGETQSARSACTKAASDLREQTQRLHQARGQAQEMLQIDPALLSDPGLLEELKSQLAGIPNQVEPLECNPGLPREKLAAHTSQMITTAEEMKKQETALLDAATALTESKNSRGLEQLRSQLQHRIDQAQQLLAQGEQAEVDTQARSALAAQREDSVQLLEKSRATHRLSDAQLKEHRESLSAAVDRLDEDLQNLRQAITQKETEKAQQEAERQRLAEELRQAELREAQRRLQEQQSTQSVEPGRNTCELGAKYTDAAGRQWQCLNTRDRDTGQESPSWAPLEGE